MDGSRFWWLLVLSLTVAVNPTAWSQSVKPRQPSVTSSNATENQPRSSVKSNDVTCKVYALNELGSDPNLGQWIADTIPEVIQPGSWSIVRPGTVSYSSPTTSGQAPSPPQDGNQRTTVGGGEARRTLSYYAPGRILVVCHTAEAHAQIGEFLQTLKKTLPQEGAKLLSSGVVQASASTPEPLAESSATVVKKATAYPIPAPQQQPKHLFHFVVRYEGDGVIDSALTGLVRKMSPESDDKSEKREEPKTDPESGSPLNQLFHLIVRYEGEGLVDSNVVEFMKALQDYNTKQEQRSNPPTPVTATPPTYYPAYNPYSGAPVPPGGCGAPGCPTQSPYPMVAPVPTGSNTGRMPLADEQRLSNMPSSLPPPFPSPPAMR